MELTYYADFAVRLVNTEEPLRGKDTLTSVEAVRALFGEAQHVARRASEGDVTRLRGVRGRLRAVFTAAGRNELDAAVMNGSDLTAGAVAGLTTTRHPIAAARAVMEQSPHVMLIGQGADTFAAGTRAVIYEYDSAGEFFWVVPADLSNRSKER